MVCQRSRSVVPWITLGPHILHVLPGPNLYFNDCFYRSIKRFIFSLSRFQANRKSIFRHDCDQLPE